MNMIEFYKQAKAYLLKNNIKAYKPKTLEPSNEGDEVVDYDELFEHFDSREFQSVFNKNHLKFHNTMAMCFIFFMSNYVWDKKIYLSKPDITIPIMNDILVFLNLHKKDYIELFGNPVLESSKLTSYIDKPYRGSYQGHKFKPYAIQIEKYFDELRISESETFYYTVDGIDYEIMCLDEPYEYFKSLYFRPKSRILINDFLLLRNCDSKIEMDYEMNPPKVVTINEKLLDKLSVAYH